jgi:hypothetical protein
MTVPPQATTVEATSAALAWEQGLAMANPASEPSDLVPKAVNSVSSRAKMDPNTAARCALVTPRLVTRQARVTVDAPSASKSLITEDKLIGSLELLLLTNEASLPLKTSESKKNRTTVLLNPNIVQAVTMATTMYSYEETRKDDVM